jgi:hypothetical protein
MKKKNTTKRGRARERESIERISIHSNQAEKNILTAGEHIKPRKNREKESTRIFFFRFRLKRNYGEM